MSDRHPVNLGVVRAAMSPVHVRFKKLDPDAKAPAKAYPGDAGWDLYAYCPDRSESTEVCGMLEIAPVARSRCC
jgi:hypothetical protein